MYVSNKQEQNYFIVDANLHDCNKIYGNVNQINKSILAQRPHLPYSNKLFSDPTGLGRYMNYRGASSKIAQYIKSLEPVVRAAFVVEKSPPLKTARYTPKISENLKLKIDRLNNFQQDESGKKFFQKRSPRMKLPSVLRYYKNPSKNWNNESKTIEVESCLS